MKKVISYIAGIVCITLLFSGCSLVLLPNPDATTLDAKQTDPSEQIAIQQTQGTKVTQATQPTETKPPAPTLPEGTPLTAEDLEWFQSEFFSNKWVDDNENRIFNIRNMFLRVEFTTVKEIDLSVLFREGVRLEEPITQEEINAFDQVVGSNILLDIYKTPKWDMEMAFLHNTGVTIDQTQKIGLDKFLYLEQYDAYYNKHGDIAYSLYKMKAGVRLENGTVMLLYKDKFSSPADDWIVTLKPHENTYWFVSNLPVK